MWTIMFRGIYSLRRNCYDSWVTFIFIKLLFSNNTCDINLYECVEKEKFAFDKVDSSAAMSIDTTATKYDREAAMFAVKKTLKKK